MPSHTAVAAAAGGWNSRPLPEVISAMVSRSTPAGEPFGTGWPRLRSRRAPRASLTLTPRLDRPEALLVALVSRAIMTVADLLLAGAAVLRTRRARRPNRRL